MDFPLTGMVKDAAEKSLVTKRVPDIMGGTRVKNEITVETAKTR
jgi:hypothetical protein